MPIIGTYSGGGTVSLANRFDTIGELMTQLADNTSNSIVAQDVRDPIYTLWERVNEVQILASQSASASSYFTNATQVPVTVGGITAGMSFSGTYSMQQMFDLLLYPYQEPLGSLGSYTLQYGSPTTVTFAWSVTKRTNPIDPIVVHGNVKTTPVPPNASSGSQNLVGTHSVTPSVSQTNTFTMFFGDSVTMATYSTTGTVTWLNKRYWGRVDLDPIGSPNLTTNPGSASMVGSYITDTTIKLLSGANANSQLFGNELSTTKSKTYNGMDGSGQYLVFAWPSTVAGPTAPSFNVNGLPSTAFTRVRTNSGFSNEWGFTGTNYEVWVSNTAQNSPLNIIIS